MGPAITAALAVPLGPVPLLLISAVFLEIAVQCIRRLMRARSADVALETTPERARPIGGGVLAGVVAIARSPYLLGICLYIVLFTTASTFVYFLQAHIVAAAFDDAAERTRLFTLIDMAVGALTIVTQLFVTGRLVRRLGVGGTLAFLPAIGVAGFAVLAVAPAVAAVVAFQALRRAANFAISRPAREILFTVVTPEQKYKARNVIDTAVYRGGDAVAGWAFAGLAGLGLETAAIALVGVPLGLLWLAFAVALGRRQDRMAAAAA